MGLLDLPLNRRLLADLSARIAGRLLPLQRHAVEQTGFLAGESLLVSAPTASGKTLLAELAAIRALEAARTVLYLVPTRALAAEKARDLARWLAPHGIRVAQSTRDHRADDAAIAAGRVGVAVAVYEKAAALLARDPGMMARAGLIVCDEVQMLGEPRRGAVIDLLLARWKITPTAVRPQLLALSAVLARPESLAAWLGVRLVRWDARPFPLREGVLDIRTGQFHWRDASTGEEGTEPLLDPATPAEGLPDVLSQLADVCAPILVFCATRREATALARETARRLPSTDPACCECLAELAPTHVCALLEELFPAGVGLHTADLTEDQRLVVEAAFARGDLRVLIATPTLEQGVNLRAATVVHSPRMIGEDPVTGAPIALPLARIRYRNQAGRAGRTADTIGRSILVVDGDFESDQARRSLLTAGLEEIASHMTPAEWLAAGAGYLANARARSAADLQPLFAATFALHDAGQTAVRARVDDVLADGVRAGYWTLDDTDRLRLLPAGEAAAATGLAPDTMGQWSQWLANAQLAPEPLALLFLLLLADEAEPELPPVDRAAWRRNQWTHALSASLTGRCPIARRLRGELTERGGVPQRWHAAARAALILADWCNGQPVTEMEDSHGMPAGRIERLARVAAWLASGAATLCGCLGNPAVVIDGLEQLGQSLGQTAPVAAATRIDTAPAESPSGEGEPMLDFPESDVGHVVFAGRKVCLPPLQYRLLRLLASRPGCAVSYAEIHEQVWPDAAVEQRQICHHRVQIERRLGVPSHSLIETHPGWGLALKVAGG